MSAGSFPRMIPPGFLPPTPVRFTKGMNMFHKRDFKRDDDMNNPVRKMVDNQKTVNVIALTALGVSLITLIIVMGMVGGRNANR